MKKIIYLIPILLLSHQIFGQANLDVDDETLIRQTVDIGKSNIDQSIELSLNTANSGVPVIALIEATGTEGGIGANSNGGLLGSLTGDVTFRTQGITHLNLNQNGNFGVGTSFADAVLHVSENGSANVNNPVLMLESVQARNPVLQFSEGGVANTAGMAFLMEGNISPNRFHVRSSGNVRTATFADDGDMGLNIIGDPAERLHINGNIQIEFGPLVFMEGSTSKAFLTMTSVNVLMENAETNGDIEITSDNSDVIMEAIDDDVIIDTGDDIAFRVDGTNKMFYRASGRLGINNASPDGMIHIKQETGSHGMRIQDHASLDDWGWDIGSNDMLLRFNNNQVGFFNDADGSYNASSDRRLKNSIEDIEDGVLEKILKLKPSSYNYIDSEEDERSVGFIAQDVQELFPSVIVISKEENDEEYLSISYELLNVLIIKAIQEQNVVKENLMEDWSQLTDLEKELEEVNALISNLSSELSELESK